jgi:hypothetical protein
MSERTDSVIMAQKILERPFADPDDDLAIFSRQLLRRVEAIERLEKTLSDQQDGTLDLVHANRD